MDKYSKEIMVAVRQNLGLEEDDESKDAEIMEMDKDEILDKVATWNGLLGYGNTIKTWVEDIYNVAL